MSDPNELNRLLNEARTAHFDTMEEALNIAEILVRVLDGSLTDKLEARDKALASLQKIRATHRRLMGKIDEA